MKYRLFFAIAVFASSVLATEAGLAQFVKIVGSPGFDTPCPGQTYSYGYNFTGIGLQNTGQLWSVSVGGSVVGSPYSNPGRIKWGNTATSSTVSLTVYVATASGSIQSSTFTTRHITIKSSPNTASPSIVGATASAPNYLAPGAPVTFSVPAIPNVNSYSWTFPSCFSPAAATTPTPVVTVQKTGNCSGPVSVAGRNNSCSFSSPSTSLVITRGSAATLPAIAGPDEFCYVFPLPYFVPKLPGIDSYHWAVPTSWEANGEIGGSGNVIILSPRPGSSQRTGSISVYGTINGFVNSNTVTKNVTINQVPPIPATLDYIISRRGPLCPGVSLSFTAAPSVGATSYEWAVDGLFRSNASRFFSFIETTPGPHTVTVRARNSCGSSDFKSKDYNVLSGFVSICGADIFH